MGRLTQLAHEWVESSSTIREQPKKSKKNSWKSMKNIPLRVVCVIFLSFGYVIDVIPLSLAEKETRRKYITRRKKEKKKEKKRVTRERRENNRRNAHTTTTKAGEGRSQFECHVHIPLLLLPSSSFFILLLSQLYTFVASGNCSCFHGKGFFFSQLIIISRFV